MIWWYWVNWSVPAGVGIGTFIVSNQTGQVSQTVCGTPSYSRSTARARSSGRSSFRRDATFGLATGSTRSPKSLVEPFAIEVLDPVLGDEADLHRGLRALESRELRHEPERRERHGRAHRHRRRAARRPHRRRRRAEAVERAAHGLQIALTRVRQEQRAGAAVEELRPELLLERLHLPADRGLGEEELLARLGEGEMPRGSLEALEEIERRQVAGRHLHSSAACMGYRQVVCTLARLARTFQGGRVGGRRRRCMQTAHYREQRDEHQGRYRSTRPAALGHADP